MLDFASSAGTMAIAMTIDRLHSRSFPLLALLLLTAQNVCLASPRKWIELRSPHFVVVTNASEHEARQVAEQFETIRSVFQEYFRTASINDRPLIIIAASDQSTFRPLLPEAWTQKGAARRSGIYLNGPDKSYIGLQVDQPYENIYHEYIHYLMRRMNPKLPTWMVEGLAEFYANFRIESKKVLVGAPSASNLRILSQHTPLPLTTLFEVNASSPYYNEESKISIFYAESWALTHYLMARDWDENTHRLSDFIGLLGPNVSQVDAARKTIGDPAVLEPALNEYVHKFTFTAARLDRPQIEQGDFHVREISEAESLAVRADFLAHEAQYARAQEMLEQSTKLDPKLALAFQVMAFSYFQQGKVADAEKSSAEALALEPRNPLANYYHATSLLRGGLLDDEIVANAIASLLAVIETYPGFAPAYDALAYALARPGAHQKLDDSHKMVLMAVEQDPTNVHYQVRLVEVLEQMGRADDAIQAATLATSMAKTPADQSAVSAALSGAKQFQVSQKKMKELQQSQAPSNDGAGQGPQQPLGGSAQGGVEVLSDTMGVDFGPYLRPVVQTVQKTWYNLVPPVARPPLLKKGRVVIEYAIARDGSVNGMQLATTSNDPQLDRAAWGSITASNPFPPLPAEFKGPFLKLRFHFFYNPGPADPTMAQSIWRVDTRLRENLNSDKNATADLDHEVVALTSLLNAGKLSKGDELMARYYRAITLQTMNNLRERHGEKVDLLSAQEALDDFDRVIAGEAEIPTPAVTASAAEYYAGGVAFWQIGSETKAYSYWNKCADKGNTGCLYNMATAHLTGEGGEKVDLQQALDLYHKIVDKGMNSQCFAAYAALRIAKLAYFANVRRSADDDPLAWVHKSYELSDQVAALLKKKTACEVEGARVEEFLYRLSRGERRNDLLDRANSESDESAALKTAAKYFDGAIDEKAFESGVEASTSERDRCYAYFEAMWYSEITKNHSAARKYYARMSENDNTRCKAEIVFAKKFSLQN